MRPTCWSNTKHLHCHSPADKGGAGKVIGIPVVGVPASVGALILRSKRIDLLWDADELPVSGEKRATYA